MDIQTGSSGERSGVGDRDSGIVHTSAVVRAVNLDEIKGPRGENMGTKSWHVPTFRFCQVRRSLRRRPGRVASKAEGIPGAR